MAEISKGIAKPDGKTGDVTTELPSPNEGGGGRMNDSMGSDGT